MDDFAGKDQVTQQTQESLVKTHKPLVKKIAYYLSGRLPKSILMEDLVQAGMLGLLEALRAYSDDKGASFETYASIRIRGFILDEVRRNDWVPRSVYRNARMIAEAVKTVENRVGREASDHDVADELGLNLLEYHELLADANGAHLYGFEDLGVTDDLLRDDHGMFCEPQTAVMHEDTCSHLAALIDGLPKNERLVLSLYYEHDLNLKEIGELMGVTESRISQIHSQATHRIKSRWEQLYP